MSEGFTIIDSMAHDCHAHAVAWAMREQGHHVKLLFGENFPSRSEIDILSAGSAIDGYSYRGPESAFELSPEKSITYWARRLSAPVVGSDIDEDDRSAVANESRTVLASLRRRLDDLAGGFAVNGIVAARRAEQKPHQLHIARAVGLSVPKTLFSSSTAQILQFAEEVGGRVIFKTNNPVVWRSSDHKQQTTHMTYSTIVSVEQISNDPAVSRCTGIYQEPIDKDYEVRLVVMGATCFATKLFSQEREGATVDWRASQRFVRNEPINTPSDISEKCISFMQRSNLLFGCFDFIVDTSGQWHFLECNEQGQWLWQEAKCPELTMLDAFSEFLSNPVPDFAYIQGQNPLRIDTYMRISWSKDLNASMAMNVIKSDAHVRHERNAVSAA